MYWKCNEWSLLVELEVFDSNITNFSFSDFRRYISKPAQIEDGEIMNSILPNMVSFAIFSHKFSFKLWYTKVQTNASKVLFTNNSSSRSRAHRPCGFSKRCNGNYSITYYKTWLINNQLDLHWTQRITKNYIELAVDIEATDHDPLAESIGSISVPNIQSIHTV